MTRRVLVPLLLSPEGLSGASASAQLASWRGLTMGTTWEVHAVIDTAAPDDVGAIIQRELDRVVAQMSNWEATSNLSRFNMAPAGSWSVLPDELFTVLEHAVHVARLSDGAYDPTLGRLVDLWGFGPSGVQAPPSSQALAEELASRGWQRIVLDRRKSRARQPGGVHVDLSGIAKGFGVDQVCRALTAAGIVSHLVEVGGELRGQGAKPDGQPWWVELEPPEHPQGDAAPITPTSIALHGLAVATSGDYRRYAIQDGVRFSHTIDPRTGRPLPEGLASVTVVHAECMVADAMATALMVMGVDAGMAWAGRHGLAARFVERDGRAWNETLTPALAAMSE